MDRTMWTITIICALTINNFVGIGTVDSRTEPEVLKMNISTNLEHLNQQSGNENFKVFIYKFMSDSLFQIERIKFPLKTKVFVDFDQPDLDTVITKENWKFDYIYMNEEYITQTYDNFDLTLRDTSERVISFEGVENGISIQYYFRRIDGKWFLVEYIDGST